MCEDLIISESFYSSMLDFRKLQKFLQDTKRLLCFLFSVINADSKCENEQPIEEEVLANMIYDYFAGQFEDFL